jgi:hypothetical protein
MCRYCMYVQVLCVCEGMSVFAGIACIQVLQVCAGMSLCAGIASCMRRYFQISTWHMPAHTYTYLYIVTYLHTVAHTECDYVEVFF